MNRRQLLAGLGGAVAIPTTGCLGGGRAGGSNDAITPSAGSRSEQQETCGIGDRPLSELLVADPGDQSECFEGAEPDLVAMNERDEPVSLSIDGVNSETFAAPVELAPGERVRESRAFVAAEDITETVTVDDAEFEVHWPERVCYHHAVAVVPDGIDVGWLEHIRGVADTQHDCYPGDPASVQVWASGGPHEVTVEIADHCEGTTETETFEVSDGDSNRLGGVLTDGGVYDVTVSVADGGEDTYEFHEGCWGVAASIDADGNVDGMGQFEMD